jgi:putative SOS response-associated peptidase YedK
MCGRYVLVTPVDEIASCFGAVPAEGLEERFVPRYNVAPTTDVLGVAEHADGSRLVRSYRWGLIPSWATDPSFGSRSFNARAETVATKPSFRAAFAKRRIVVPADGYFEWRKGPAGERQPFYLRRADGRPLALAGLSELWRDPNADADTPLLATCTIVTTAASLELAEIHDRMPVVLETDAIERWLDRTASEPGQLEAMLRPAAPGVLACYPVERRVGDVRNDDARLLEPVVLEAARTEAVLFET